MNKIGNGKGENMSSVRELKTKMKKIESLEVSERLNSVADVLDEILNETLEDKINSMVEGGYTREESEQFHKMLYAL